MTRLGDAARLAIRDGVVLTEWLREQAALSDGFPQSIVRRSGATLGRFAFGDVLLNGSRTPLMASHQRLRFPDNAESVEYVQGFSQGALEMLGWCGAGGVPRGFSFSAVVGGQSASEPGEMPMRLDIHEFNYLLPLGWTWARFAPQLLRQSAYVVPARELDQPIVERAARVEARASYAFLPVPPHRSVFGYGPGRFGAAVKHFAVRAPFDGGLDIEVWAAMSPRSEQVLDLLGYDPVYGVVRFLDRLSGRRWRLLEWVRDEVERMMLAQHMRVHEAVLRRSVARGVAAAPARSSIAG